MSSGLARSREGAPCVQKRLWIVQANSFRRKGRKEKVFSDLSVCASGDAEIGGAHGTYHHRLGCHRAVSLGRRRLVVSVRLTVCLGEDMTTEDRKLSALRPHPENAQIFGDPEESEQYEAIHASIKKHGIWEPLAIKADGTIVSGHMRFHIAQALKLASVPVRLVPDFASYRDEVEYLVRCNTDRRQLTRGEIAIVYKRLRELPKSAGGTKGKMGRPKKGEEKSGANTRLSRPRDEAATLLGVTVNEARALETVFTTPGVPDALKSAVNKGTLAPTPAAKAVRTELKRQGGEIRDVSALDAVARKPVKEPGLPAEPTRDERIAAAAAAYTRDYRKLFEIYKELDGVLSRRPLKSVIGPTEHHEYTGLIRDVSLRAWREIESVNGPTDTGKQMSLTVVHGGKKS